MHGQWHSDCSWGVAHLHQLATAGQAPPHIVAASRKIYFANGFTRSIDSLKSASLGASAAPR